MSERKSKPAKLSAPVAGLEISNLAKIKLIRKLQRIEGNVDCCASAYSRVCNQLECLWHDDCLKLAQG